MEAPARPNRGPMGAGSSEVMTCVSRGSFPRWGGSVARGVGGSPLPFGFSELGVGDDGFQEGDELVDFVFFEVDFEAGQWIVLKAGDDHFAFAVDEDEIVASPVGGVMLDGVFLVGLLQQSLRCLQDQMRKGSNFGLWRSWQRV